MIYVLLVLVILIYMMWILQPHTKEICKKCICPDCKYSKYCDIKESFCDNCSSQPVRHCMLNRMGPYTFCKKCTHCIDGYCTEQCDEGDGYEEQ